MKLILFKVLFSLSLLLLFFGILELASPYFLNRTIDKYRFLNHKSLKENYLKKCSIDCFDRIHDGLQIHPYLGFAGREIPAFDLESGEFNRPIDVLFLGGSVANATYGYAEEYYHINDSIVLRGSIPGGKQPMQLMELNYYLALTKKIKLVVNLDGYNEAVLGVLNNLPRKVPISFPNGWSFNFFAENIEPQSVQKISEFKTCSSVKKLVLSLPFKKQLSHSKFIMSIYASSLIKERDCFKSKINLRSPVVNVGLEEKYKAVNRSIDIWFQSSLLIHDLSKKHNFIYFHFLQPNQFVNGSKVFTEEELQLINDPEDSNKELATYAYPILQKRGEELEKLGVNFYSLTDVFKSESKTIYTDRCCHINDLGNELLFQAIYKIISKKYKINKIWRH